jgi:hypothetical protein
MDMMSPTMIALYIMLAAFVVAFLYIMVYGDRLALLSQQMTPDSFKEEEHKKKDEAKPLYE